MSWYDVCYRRLLVVCCQQLVGREKLFKQPTRQAALRAVLLFFRRPRDPRSPNVKHPRDSRHGGRVMTDRLMVRFYCLAHVYVPTRTPTYMFIQSIGLSSTRLVVRWATNEPRKKRFDPFCTGTGNDAVMKENKTGKRWTRDPWRRNSRGVLIVSFHQSCYILPYVSEENSLLVVFGCFAMSVEGQSRSLIPAVYIRRSVVDTPLVMETPRKYMNTGDRYGTGL